MSTPKIFKYKNLTRLAIRLRDDLNDHQFVLLFAYNATGKTRLSMEFKDRSKKRKKNPVADTLYFNAFTEDLFYWNNDLDNDTERYLIINGKSKFFDGFRELALEERIFKYLERYAEFNFKIDYDNWRVIFSKGEQDHIKISRGEQNIFIWCIFLAICELVIDGNEDGPYNWVKFIYIDDPISSLDDNNAIAVACDLSQLLKKAKDKVGVVISTHHALFFNVMFNELKKIKNKCHFLHKNGVNGYTLRATEDTPFFHHVALLSELKNSVENNRFKTHYFNALRAIMEKTASFFGLNDFSECVHGIDDEVLHERALNLLSHGAYSLFDPVEMGDETKVLFKQILEGFLEKYQFSLPKLIMEEEVTPAEAAAPIVETTLSAKEVVPPVIEKTEPVEEQAKPTAEVVKKDGEPSKIKEE